LPDVRKEPGNTVEGAADAALQAIYAHLGAEPNLVLVLIDGATVPVGEQPNVTAAAGTMVPDDLDERAKLMLSLLVSHAHYVAKAAGLNFEVLVAQRGEG